MTVNYDRRPNVAYLKQDFFELLEGNVSEMLLLDRLLFRLYKKFGLQALQEELDGTEVQAYHGWLELDFDKLRSTLVMQFSDKTIRRAVEHLEEQGYLLVLRSEGWKKANKYRPCIKAIKDGLEKLGWPLVIDRSSISEDDIEWGADSVKNNPPPPPQKPENPTTSQEESWEAVPGATLTVTQKDKDEVKEGSDWAKQYRILNNAPDHLKWASYIFAKMTGLEPSGTGNSWTAQISGLWNACESNQQMFTLVLQKGMEAKYERPELRYTGPRSFLYIANDIKAMKRSSVINQKKQETLKQSAKDNNPVPERKGPVIVNGQTPKRFILKPLVQPEQSATT